MSRNKTNYISLVNFYKCRITNYIGGFHAISGDTNDNGEMNKCWWTNKGS